MIRQFAEFILRSRSNALLIATATFMLPLTSWLSSVVIALTVLRHGWREGMWIILSLAFVSGVLFTVFEILPLNIVPAVLSGPLIVWGLAVMLRAFNSWSLVLMSAFYGGCALVFIFKILLGLDASGIADSFAGYQQSPELRVIVNFVLAYFVGLQVAILLFSALLFLALARGVQAMLFNRGGLYREIMQIRLPLHVAIVSILVVISSMLGVTGVKDLVPVVILVYFLAGLSIIHSALPMVRKAWPWVVGFYAFLVLFFIYMIMVVATLGLTDTFVDIRRRLFARMS
jgi:hypothetical protein